MLFGLIGGEKKKWKVGRAKRVSGDRVYIVNGHEIRQANNWDGISPACDTFYVCWKCGKDADTRGEFEEIDCHDCNCRFCDRP